MQMSGAGSVGGGRDPKTGQLIELPMRNVNSPLQRINKNLTDHHASVDRDWADTVVIPETEKLHMSIKVGEKEDDEEQRRRAGGGATHFD